MDNLNIHIINRVEAEIGVSAMLYPLNRVLAKLNCNKIVMMIFHIIRFSTSLE